MGSDLSWTTIIRAHRHGGVQLETAKLISKICHKLKGVDVPPLSMMEPCDPPPAPRMWAGRNNGEMPPDPKPAKKKKASARKKKK